MFDDARTLEIHGNSVVGDGIRAITHVQAEVTVWHQDMVVVGEDTIVLQRLRFHRATRSSLRRIARTISFVHTNTTALQPKHKMTIKCTLLVVEAWCGTINTAGTTSGYFLLIE